MCCYTDGGGFAAQIVYMQSITMSQLLKLMFGLWLVLLIITTTWLLGNTTFLQPNGLYESVVLTHYQSTANCCIFTCYLFLITFMCLHRYKEMFVFYTQQRNSYWGKNRHREFAIYCNVSRLIFASKFLLKNTLYQVFYFSSLKHIL